MPRAGSGPTRCAPPSSLPRVFTCRGSNPSRSPGVARLEVKLLPGPICSAPIRRGVGGVGGARRCGGSRSGRARRHNVQTPKDDPSRPIPENWTYLRRFTSRRSSACGPRSGKGTPCASRPPRPRSPSRPIPCRCSSRRPARQPSRRREGWRSCRAPSQGRSVWPVAAAGLALAVAGAVGIRGVMHRASEPGAQGVQVVTSSMTPSMTPPSPVGPAPGASAACGVGRDRWRRRGRAAGSPRPATNAPRAPQTASPAHSRPPAPSASAAKAPAVYDNMY